MLSQDIKLGLEHIAEMQKHKSMENYEHHETDDETDNKVNTSLPYFGVKLSRVCLKVTFS